MNGKTNNLSVASRVDDTVFFSIDKNIHEVPVPGVGDFYISKQDIVLITQEGEIVIIDETNFEIVENSLAA